MVFNLKTNIVIIWKRHASDTNEDMIPTSDFLIETVPYFFLPKMKKDENGKIDFSSVNNDLRIKAAITFYSLHNKDEEINIMLKYVKETSEDENLRKYLAQIL